MYSVSNSKALQKPRTLADLIGSQSMVRDALLVIGFSLFMALCAQIAIPLPWTPVPITGQTLGVLLTAAILGPKRGGLAMLLYLAEGAVGLPVFAPVGAPGFARLIGPTGGYLMSYPLVAFLVGALAARGWDRKIPSAVAMLLIGNIVIYAIGVPWLMLYKNLLLVDVLSAGFYPFIPGDLLKIGLVALALPGAWKLFGRQSDQ